MAVCHSLIVVVQYGLPLHHVTCGHHSTANHWSWPHESLSLSLSFLLSFHNFLTWQDFAFYRITSLCLTFQNTLSSSFLFPSSTWHQCCSFINHHIPSGYPWPFKSTLENMVHVTVGFLSETYKHNQILTCPLVKTAPTGQWRTTGRQTGREGSGVVGAEKWECVWDGMGWDEMGWGGEGYGITCQKRGLLRLKVAEIAMPADVMNAGRGSGILWSL